MPKRVTPETRISTSGAPRGFAAFMRHWKGGEDCAPLLTPFGVVEKDERVLVARVHGLIRGHGLLAQARAWTSAEVGKGGLSTHRGCQWQLVMAYAGFELLIKSLLGKTKGGLEEGALNPLFENLALPNFDPLPPPSLKRASLNRWLEEQSSDAVLDFLKLDKGDRNRFNNWLLDQAPVSNWTNSVLLAKSLRNTTAHGALSANKVREWGLAKPMKRLVSDLVAIDEAVFDSLGR